MSTLNLHEQSVPLMTSFGICNSCSCFKIALSSAKAFVKHVTSDPASDSEFLISLERQRKLVYIKARVIVIKQKGRRQRSDLDASKGKAQG